MGASVLRDAEQSQKLFLQRLFPDELKDISTKVSHKDWLEELALKVEHSKVVASRNQVAKELKEQQKEEIKGSSEEDLQKLEGQVKHYKSVLDETVSVSLHTVRNLHFLSKNSTLISRENCRFFLGEKTRQNVVVLGFLAVDNFDFMRKNCAKKFWVINS